MGKEHPEYKQEKFRTYKSVHKGTKNNEDTCPAEHSQLNNDVYEKMGTVFLNIT